MYLFVHMCDLAIYTPFIVHISFSTTCNICVVYDNNLWKKQIHDVKQR